MPDVDGSAMTQFDSSKIKVGILAGGLGSRLAEETETKPKPMVEIGGMPILWHIMKIYANFGITDFSVALGYKGEIIKRWFNEPYLAKGGPVVDKVAQMIRSTPAMGYVGCCHAIPMIDVTARLAEIKCPIQVIVGEQDAGTPVSMAQEIHHAAPNSELVIIPNASHLSNMEQPEAFDKAMMGFLARS